MRASPLFENKNRKKPKAAKASSQTPPVKIKKKRKKKFRLRIRHFLYALLVVSLVLMLGWLAGQMRENTDMLIYRLSEKLRLNVDHIYISGQNLVTTEEVLAAMEVAQGQPLLLLNLEDIKQNIQTIGWVHHARVERQLPNTLHVYITERVPSALWQYKGEIKVVDNEGRRYEGETDLKESNLYEMIQALPLLVGEGAYLNTEALFEFINKEPALYKYVTSMSWVGNRRWNIRFRNGVEVLLPEKGAKEAWDRLITLQREKQLLNRQIKTVDLRLPDRVFIETEPLEETSAKAKP